MAIPSAKRDLTRQRSSAAFWWGIPLIIGLASGFAELALTVQAAIWSGAFCWMGIGCVLNARRCGRRHCFVSGPSLLTGAALAALVAFGAIGPGLLAPVTWLVLALVVVGYITEFVWGRYVDGGVDDR